MLDIGRRQVLIRVMRSAATRNVRAAKAGERFFQPGSVQIVMSVIQVRVPVVSLT